MLLLRAHGIADSPAKKKKDPRLEVLTRFPRHGRKKFDGTVTYFKKEMECRLKGEHKGYYNKLDLAVYHGKVDDCMDQLDTAMQELKLSAGVHPFLKKKKRQGKSSNRGKKHEENK